MKTLHVLVLVSSALLLCSAAPALQAVTCDEDGASAAVHLATRHINEHHHHGYKFRLIRSNSSIVETLGDGCNMELQLQLSETKCHIINPKHFDDCEIRSETDREVIANCTVTMTVKTDDTTVDKYLCHTRQAKTNAEMALICPDCPILLPLNDTTTLESVVEAVKKFNDNETNEHVYVLQEVGRIVSGMMGMGMFYSAQFALVETQCPRQSKIIHEACKPLCPDRAKHALCSSFADTNGLQSVECEFYPALNTTELGPGEKEQVCRHFHSPHAHDGHGPPPHARDGQGPPPHARDGQGPPPHARDGQGPPPHAQGRDRGRGHGGPPPHAGHGGPPPHAGHGGPPPHAGHGGPPPHAHGQDRVHPSRSFHFCRRWMTDVDPAIHPICPWPRFRSHPHPKLGQSSEILT